jgi:DNA-binding transcriptional LysR family regulator
MEDLLEYPEQIAGIDELWSALCILNGTNIRDRAPKMDERLKGILTFVQVADAGNFSAAAAQMRVTRSAVGKSIARLEHRLGVRLFHRSTRQQSLTESGQLFYQRCKKLLAELDAAEDALDVDREAPAGRLRISVPQLFGRRCVAPVMTALALRHPRIDLEISFSDRVVDLLQEGFDLAIRIGQLPDSSTLAARSLGMQHFVLCASPTYLAKHGMPLSIEDFSHHIGIVYASTGPEAPWYAVDESGAPRELAVQRRVRFDDVQAIADAATAGVGIARLPSWLIAESLASRELVLIDHVQHTLATEIQVVWPHTRFLSSKARVAIDALTQQIPANLLALNGARRVQDK